jgi:filamentous hemagglutinin family protein
MKLKSSGIILLSINSLSANAEVTLDGTLGRGGALPGPDYLIGADLGRQNGGNLFHSFQGFNLNRFESATFSGPNSVSNIISRVTGGNPSQINGLIRSTIPNADMYFLNPYGIMFGENAKLDVQGSFHASTADYIRLGDGGRFDARYPNESLLTIAPIEAFGFLTDVPAHITIKNSKLYVPSKQTLSLIGGPLIMNGDLSSNNELETFHPNHPLKLFAEFGRINLASIDSSGEVIPNEAGLVINASGGQITINNAWIGVSGNGAGNIFIRGGDFELFNSELEGDSLDENSGIIDVQVDNLRLHGSEISTDTHGIGQGGQILLKVVDTFSATGMSAIGYPSFVFSGTEGQLDNAADAGKIDIEARQIELTEGARIGSSTIGVGKGGYITIKAYDHLSISGKPEVGFRYNNQIDKPTSIEANDINLGMSGLFSNSKSRKVNAGNAGEISIQTETLNLTNHSVISSSAENSGGGNINISASYLIYLQNARITTTVKSGTGKGGDITVGTPLFVVLNQSRFSARAYAGHGGNIRIKSGHFLRSNNSLVTASSILGLDGNIEVDSPDENFAGGMLTLSYDTVDTSTMTKKPCEAMSYEEYENRSSFDIHPIAGSPTSPFDLQPSRVYF